LVEWFGKTNECALFLFAKNLEFLDFWKKHPSDTCNFPYFLDFCQKPLGGINDSPSDTPSSTQIFGLLDELPGSDEQPLGDTGNFGSILRFFMFWAGFDRRSRTFMLGLMIRCR